MFDLTPLLPDLIALGLILAGPLWMLKHMRQNMSGSFGRPYDLMLRDYFRETERRGLLLVLVVENRSIRIDKQERRVKRSR